MKKFISILFSFVMVLLQAQNLTQTENYIYSRTYLEPVTSEQPNAAQIQGVQYLDGLGRTVQSIAIKASPDGKDIVVPSVYDPSGKQTKKFLPLPLDTQNGAFITGIGENTVNAYYGVSNAYSEVLYEKSPLGRVMKSAAPGTEWQMSGTHTQKMEYLSNDAREVKRYRAVTVWNPSSQINDVSLAAAPNNAFSTDGYYNPNTLYKMVTRDENDKQTQTFANSKKQIVLVRTINIKPNGTAENLDTYYVYNEYGNIAYVIPPKASSSVLTPDLLNNLCYQYRYDKYNRITEKKIPGKGWEYIVYDQQGRPVLTQDANLRSTNNSFTKRGWMFTKYDKYGRKVYSGFFANTAERPAMQTALNNMSANAGNNEVPSTTPFTLNGIDVYYTKTAFPTGSMTIMGINYYDEYPAGSPAMLSQPTLQAVPTVYSANGFSSVRSTKALPTASYTKNTENDSWTSAFIWYDIMGRVIGTYSKNYLGGFTRMESELDFSGATLKSYTVHARKADEAGVTIRERFVYDARKRLKQHYHQVDSRPEELLTDNTYNNLSQVINKKVGNNLQSIDYNYNIRGWLTDVNKTQMTLADLGGKLFAYSIKYTRKEGISNPDQAMFPGKDVSPRYNGDIAETDWRAVETIGVNPPLTPKRYGYSYDSSNRMVAGYYQNPGNPYSKENTEVLDYDPNGNISSLYRTSVPEAGTNTAMVIDNLTYDYTGNRLNTITDASHNRMGYEGGGNSIGYDSNGNMTSMPDKGISSIKYNYLDLPSAMEVSRNENEYISVKTQYSADGIKLRKESTTTIIGVAGPTSSRKTTDYLDGFQYLKAENLSSGGGGSTEMMMASSESRRAMEPQAFSIDFPGPAEPGIDPPIGRTPVYMDKTPDLQYFATAEGYYDYQKDQYIYQYVDQLGNVRLSYGRNSAGALEITDANDYYPFGMNHLKTGNAYFAQGSYKSNKYNGKELQETGIYSYGWREYMPDIGRWNAIDKLAENYLSASPYAYVLNNPVNMFDPNGLASMMALTQAMWDQTPDGTNSYWQNNNLGNSDSGGKPGGGGGSFVYVGGTAGLQAGYGIGSTLDMNGNFNSYYGSVTNGVLNYMYWTNSALVNGSTSIGGQNYQNIQGLEGHKGNLNLNSTNFSSTIDWHKTSQEFRSWSGNLFSLNKFILGPAAERATLYGAGEAYSTTNLVFEKALPKILGSQKIYIPIMEMSAIRAQQLAVGSKIAGRALGGVAAGLAGYDIIKNGANTSNSLDLVMSILAVSPTGWGQAIAGTYFTANFVITLATGKDIGQHIEGAVNKYYNDGIRAEEQAKFNAAMGY